MINLNRQGMKSDKSGKDQSANEQMWKGKCQVRANLKKLLVKEGHTKGRIGKESISEWIYLEKDKSENDRSEEGGKILKRGESQHERL